MAASTTAARARARFAALRTRLRLEATAADDSRDTRRDLWAYVRGTDAAGCLRMSSRLVGCASLAAASLLVAHAGAEECRGLENLHAYAGVSAGMGTTLLASFAFSGIAVAEKPSLSYWEGFGYGMAGGAGGAVTGTVVAARAACDVVPWVPSANALGTSVLAVVIWANADPGEPPRWNVDGSIAEDAASATFTLHF
jgi:hypothetical protein